MNASRRQVRQAESVVLIDTLCCEKSNQIHFTSTTFLIYF